jgi:hypothetical protein
LISPGENSAALISPSFSRMWTTLAEQSIEMVCHDADRLREPGAVGAFVSLHRARLTAAVMSRAGAYCTPEWGVESARAPAVFAALAAASDRAAEQVIRATCEAVVSGQRARGAYLGAVRAIELQVQRWAADAVREAVEPDG